MTSRRGHFIETVLQVLALACVSVVATFACAQTAGSFDSTFGSNGRVKNLLPNTVGEAFSGAHALQPDGKIVIVGGCIDDFADFIQEVCLARLLANGSLDDTFDGPSGNGNGKFSFQLSNINASAGGVLVQPDGRIVVAINCNIGVSRVCLKRLNSDGSFDLSFDGGHGSGAYMAGSVVDMQLQPDGKILVAIRCNTDSGVRFCLLRVNSDGSYDDTLDGPDAAGTGVGTADGTVVLTLFGLGDEEPRAMALQAEGKIVLVGRCLGSLGYGLCVMRLNRNGSFDMSFDGASGNGNGRIVFGINGIDQAVGTSVAIAPDGRIVVAGFCGNSTYRFCGARLLPDGNFDPAFLGTTGNTPGRFRFTMLGAGSEEVRALSLQADGRILLAGVCENAPVPMINGKDFCFAQLNSDGSFDRSFDGPSATGNGRFAVGIANDYDYLTGLAIQRDGKIVAGGTCSDTCGGSCGGNAFCVARFEGGSQGYETCSLDIDGDGVIGVTDAALHARVALGFRSAALVDGLSFAANASRSSLNAIRDYLVANCGLVSP